MEILIIGGGFMGEAFAKGLMQKGNVPKSDIIIVEVNKERRTELSNQGYTVRENVFEACDSASVILVAIKPQDINHLTNLGNYISQETLLISIAAGISIPTIQKITKHTSVIRVMPNLPAAIGEGAIVYLVSDKITVEQKNIAKVIFDAVSTIAIEVQNESEINLATAVHGSGPAYVFLLMESMIEAAVTLGMPRADALALVRSTVKGSAIYANEGNVLPQELRNAVTSPGGTTEAAIAKLEALGFQNSLNEAIKVAFTKANDLGKSNNRN
tara:strand:- start:725 stop:1537 length:813 start_codon:yes stop_codon:yes gene_type:complete